MKTYTIENETNNIIAHATVKDAEAVEHAERFRNEAGLIKLAERWPTARLVEIWNSLPGASPVKKFADRKTAAERIWKAIQNLGDQTADQRPDATAEIATEPAQASEAEPILESAAAPDHHEAPIPEAEQPLETRPTPSETQGQSLNTAESEGEPTPFDEPVAPVSAQVPDVASTDGKPTKKATPAKKTPTGEPKAKKPREGSKTDTILSLLKSPGGASLKQIMEATSWQAHSVRGFVSGMLTKKMGLTVVSAKSETGERTYSIAP